MTRSWTYRCPRVAEATDCAGARTVTQARDLLLDEPTENLDADQRARLTGVIREYARERTCIVISHDMDFIAAVADRILVLENGRIAQIGDHHALMAEGGLYKRLYEAQNVDPNLVYATRLAAQ